MTENTQKMNKPFKAGSLFDEIVKKVDSGWSFDQLVGHYSWVKPDRMVILFNQAELYLSEKCDGET